MEAFNQIFKRDAPVDAETEVIQDSGPQYHHEPTKKAQLQQSITPISAQFISIGSAIGTGLLIGSGKCLTAGPLVMMIGYSVTSMFIYLMCQALGELTVTLPLNGGFTNYTSRLLGPNWGFTLAWNYGLQWASVLPMQLIAARITMDYWNDAKLPITIPMFIVVMAANLFSVRIYAYLQTFFSIIKLFSLALFAIAAVGVNMGAFNDDAIGFKYWKNPGPISDQGLLGLVICISTSIFSFAGTELIGVTSSEQMNPEETVPIAIKQLSMRVVSVILPCAFIISLSVPYNDHNLIGSAKGSNSSPFVLALSKEGGGVASSLMNGVVLVTVISLGVSSVYAASRTLVALAENGHAPSCFTKTTNNGTPFNAVVVVGLVGVTVLFLDFWPEFLDQALMVFISFGGASILFSYLTICACHIRLRRLLSEMDIPLAKLHFQAQFGIYGSIIAVTMATVLLLLQPCLPFFSPESSSKISLTTIAECTLGLFVLLILYLLGLLYCCIRDVKFKEEDNSLSIYEFCLVN